MTFDTIYQFFEAPQLRYLNKELAACYVMSVLSQQDSYGTELIQLLETQFPSHRLSDTVLYTVLQFLEGENVIQAYWKKVEKRGRPRRMYHIREDAMAQARSLTQLWRDYIKEIYAQPNSKVLVHN
jgi:DNA-binding PadR family transcriptional regulator